MIIDVDNTELSEGNFDDFMKALDAEFENQYPEQGMEKYSETLTKEDWLFFSKGDTIQDIISGEVECWEED